MQGAIYKQKVVCKLLTVGLCLQGCAAVQLTLKWPLSFHSGREENMRERTSTAFCFPCAFLSVYIVMLLSLFFLTITPRIWGILQGSVRVSSASGHRLQNSDAHHPDCIPCYLFFSLPLLCLSDCAITSQWARLGLSHELSTSRYSDVVCSLSHWPKENVNLNCNRKGDGALPEVLLRGRGMTAVTS